MQNLDGWKKYILNIGRHKGVIALGIVFVLCILFSPTSGGSILIRSLFSSGATGSIRFLSMENHASVFRDVSEIGILATGMTLVIITAGIDLSVGSVLALTAVFFSFVLLKCKFHTVPAVVLTLCIGAGAGAICGFLIARFRIQPFIATLAMMVSARGVAKWIFQGSKVQSELIQVNGVDVRDTPWIFDWLGGRIFDDQVTIVSIIFLITILAFHLILAHTAFGRSLYAIGGGEEAARLSGINITTVKTTAYLICGLLAGLAGMCHAAQDTYGNPDAGQMYELKAIAAVVIGGTSLMGGRGGMFQTFLGVMIIGYLENILRLNNVDSHIRLVVQGAIIVAAVLIQQPKKH